MAAFASRIVVLRPAMVGGRYASEPSPDWTVDPERVEVPFLVSVQPVSSSEGSPERPTVTTRWRLIGPPGRDIALRAVDRVEVDGEAVFSVDGDVGRWRLGPAGRVHHVEAALERVEG